MTHMAKTDQLDLALPAEMLGLGELLAARGSLRRPSPRQSGAQQPDAEQVGALVDAVLAKVVKDTAARKLLGLPREASRDAGRIRLKAVALLAWQSLRLSMDHMELGEIAAAAADPKLSPAEALLRARHEVGMMVAEDVLIGMTDGSDGPFCKARLPGRTLEWLSGGKASMGHLTVSKLVGLPLPQEDRDKARPAEPLKIPTPRQLYDAIRSRVIGLDRQAEVISARLVMHMTRAKLLRARDDPGTPNECWLVIGPPGVGKTHICQVAGEKSGIIFATADGSDLTSEGYVGLSFSDTVRQLLLASKGNLESARYGFLAVDEFTKKARSMGDSPINTVAVQQEALRVISGQSMQLGGRRGWDRPVQFSTVGTAFALMGHCPGLARLVEKRMGRRRMGFSLGDDDRRSRTWLADCLIDFGLIQELISRLTATLIIPPPDRHTLMVAVSAEGGIVDSYNRLLGEHGAMLFLSPAAVEELAEYGMESGGYFRALKRVVSALAGQVIFEERKGTALIEAADIRRAAYEADGNSGDLVGARGKAGMPVDPMPDDGTTEADSEVGFASP